MINIDLNIDRGISDRYYGAISTIDKNSESVYYLVKWTIESYIFQLSQKLVKCVIKAGELVCDAAYLNPLDIFKKLYSPYEIQNQGKKLSGWILLF